MFLCVETSTGPEALANLLVQQLSSYLSLEMSMIDLYQVADNGNVYMG